MNDINYKLSEKASNQSVIARYSFLLRAFYAKTVKQAISKAK